MAGRIFRSIRPRKRQRELFLSPYDLVRQNTNSSSPAASSDIMLGDVDFDDSSEIKENMSQMEMHQVFVGSPPSSPVGQKARLKAQERGLLRNSKSKKSKRYKKGRSMDQPLWGRMHRFFFRDKTSVHDRRDRTIRYQAETISIYRNGEPFPKRKCIRNDINNQKYSLLSFLPMFLYEQFNQFWNLYFLFICITQLPIPGSIFEDFWIGYWWTTALPLAFVVSISLIREAFDDVQRRRRDYLINYEKVERLNLETGSIETIASCKIRTGDLIILYEGSRVPCDMVLVYCENQGGSTFIKTDQLDGETDWKLRRPIPSVQKSNGNKSIDKVTLCGDLTVEAPHQDIYKFMGKFQHFEDWKAMGPIKKECDHFVEDEKDDQTNVDALSLENTLWGSTRIASEGAILGCAVYLGTESRSQLNANAKTSKVGKIDKELNWITKLLVTMLVFISFLMTMVRGVHKNSGLYFGRFMLILSDIIPLSLRVYMDLAKIWFSLSIQRDKRMPETTVRCTTIPEELGRVEYLFTDKTGTLTQNEMIFRALALGPPVLFQSHNSSLIHHHCVSEVMSSTSSQSSRSQKRKSRKSKGSRNRKKRDSKGNLIGIDELRKSNQSNSSLLSRPSSVSPAPSNHSNISSGSKSVQRQVWDSISALALCHNVTPIVNDDGRTNYEASSPDEIAMVKFTEKCGVQLIHRTTEQITLRIHEVVDPQDNLDDDLKFENESKENASNFLDLEFKILNIFPFTSESKRMGIIVESVMDGSITFYAKGADVVMKNMVESNEWMEEEVENLSREGLRTLVFASKSLSKQQYDEFAEKFADASVSMSNSRAVQMMSVRQRLLEQEMNLLAVTGVEDKLQDAVQSTIEMLRNAHIKIWMLTGDKVETAKVVARSSRLIAFGNDINDLMVKNRREAYHKLDVLFGRNRGCHNIVIDGASLEVFMNGNDDNLRTQFLEFMMTVDVVIACRCSPTQKAEMVSAVQERTDHKAVCCAVGDGGNDVSMILAANVGVGLVGKEGQQAALSSDYSIDKFKYLSILLLWHGRLAYKNTAVMAQFVIHRGLIIAFITVIFSIIFYFAAIPLFTGVLMVGYTCVYTSLPVFSLVLDRDISFSNSLFYPELYHPLQAGNALNHKTFLLWVMRSFYQGSIIMFFTLILFESELHNIVSIAFTALILTELFNVYLEVHRLHWLMLLSEAVSILLYLLSIILLSATYFDAAFVFSAPFWWKSFLIALTANIPVAITKQAHKLCHPSMQQKLKEDHL